MLKSVELSTYEIALYNYSYQGMFDLDDKQLEDKEWRNFIDEEIRKLGNFYKSSTLKELVDFLHKGGYEIGKDVLLWFEEEFLYIRIEFLPIGYFMGKFLPEIKTPNKGDRTYLND